MFWDAQRVRQTFLKFFENKGHTVVPSSPLLPHGDPTLLFTNAGMNQFKAYFLGERTPPFRRATSVQKCIRAGGKHNDLDNVGFTRRHHTFFEMLGNFSFGDYFKKEAIIWAWELVTEHFKLDPDKLWVSVYEDDDEGFEIWEKIIKIPSNKILRLGKKENFWEMGDTGPAGPCSEIHYDLGEEFDPNQKSPAQEGERFLELWNLVFMELERKPDGSLVPLPSKNIDTGMGLERILAVLQGVDSNFHTDLFMPIIDEIVRITDVPYSSDERGAPHRVIADHARALTFAIADHIYPSNFGRGYVLRRILRRAHRFGKKIGINEPILYRLVPVVIYTMKSAYPELESAKTEVELIIKREEERFLETLSRNLPRLEDAVENAKLKGILDGETVFKLYDTYGLPLDLIEEVSAEAGIQLDWNGFDKYMAVQKELAKKKQKTETLPEFVVLNKNYKGTTFIGYETLTEKSKLVKYAQKNGTYYLVFEKTPFYARAGGQESDKGLIRTNGVTFKVEDTVRIKNDIVHIAKLIEGEPLLKETEYELVVDSNWRYPTMRAHTATHLLHASLREVLGEHVRQEGSLVEPDRTRFDFSHPVALTDEEIEAIEDLVNQKIRENLQVTIEWMDYHRAIEQGAMAIFEEKYGATVRVVSCGDFSKELCGGTHVSRTGDIGVFVIAKEEAAASGIRRIDAYTGQKALNFLRNKRKMLKELSLMLNADERNLAKRSEKLLSELAELQQQNNYLSEKLSSYIAKDLISKTSQTTQIITIFEHLEGLELSVIQKITDHLVSRIHKPFVILLLGSKNGRVSIFSRVHPDISTKIQAKDLVRRVAKELGGGGGGTNTKAEGGGKDVQKISKALQMAKNIVKEKTA